MRSLSPVRIQVIIVVSAFLLFLPGLGAVHLFDWDEINFAEIAREMISTGDWSRPQIEFKPFYEKPPLFMWMQALGMSVFGVGEFAARFPNVICGAITLLVLYRFYGCLPISDPFFRTSISAVALSIHGSTCSFFSVSIHSFGQLEKGLGGSPWPVVDYWDWPL